MRLEEENENVQDDATRSVLNLCLLTHLNHVSGGNAEAALKDGGGLPSKIRCLMGANVA